VTEKPKRPELIADTLKKPIMLLWMMLLPQLLLLVLNLSAWKLVRGDMDPEQMNRALILGGAEGILLLLGLGSWILLSRLKRRIDWPVCIGLLAVHIAYLWLFTAWLWNLLPQSATVWILQPTQLCYYQFALMMPAIFYAAVRLSGFNWRVSRWLDASVTLATLVGVPVMWFAFFHLVDALWRVVKVPYLVWLVFGIISTVLVLVAFLRLLLFLYGLLSGTRAGAYILPLFAGLLAPLGGLWLNHAIPFPYDFQSPHVYILTVLNGIILLLPFFRGRSGTLIWMLRSMLYSFSLYFFVVFLPYLPLSLLAMIAAGAGFLILAPTLLFVIHTRRLLTEGAILAARWGTGRVVLLFLVCALSLPAAYVARAWVHRQALVAAIDAAYTPDYRTGQAPVNLDWAEWSLRRLRAMKDGMFVPFLSDIYNRIVFGGMVLPDHKIDHIATTLFGGKLEFEKPKRDGFSSFFGARGRGRGQRWRNAPPPPRNVALADVATETETADGQVQVDVTLTLTNSGSRQAEFVTDIALPPGVLVSGYWLDVEGTRVPGRVFEKKTAMWVYHMIRDATRRDPGLVVYEAADRIKLRVFPFSSNQTRVTGLTFLYPEGTTPAITIGNQAVDLPVPPVPRVVRVPAGPDTDWAVVPAQIARELPHQTRTPYPHFIVDRSLTASGNDADFAERMRSLSAQFPDAGNCRITLANFEFTMVGDRPVPMPEIAAVLERSSGLSYRGALCPERAIKGALLDLAEGGDAGSVPVFIVVAAKDAEILTEGGLDTFAHLVPDMPRYFVSQPDRGLEGHAFDGGSTTNVWQMAPPGSVVLLRAGQATLVCDAEQGGVALLTGPRDGLLEVRDVDGYRPVAHTSLPADSAYARGAALWEQCRRTSYEPATLTAARAGIVQASRDTGILTPLTSFIVVENQAQWEIMKRKEGQALKAHQALAFDEFVESMESPEPSILWFLPVVYLLWRKKRKR